MFEGSARGKDKRDQLIVEPVEYAQQVVEDFPSGLLTLSRDCRVLSANRWFLEAYHPRTDDVVGRRLDEVIRAEGLEEQVRQVLNGGAYPLIVFTELSVVGQGEVRPARITISRLGHEEKGGQLLLVVEDLKESTRGGGAAEASERCFRELVESLGAIVWEADAETFQFTFVSQPAEKILGYPVEQWLREQSFWAKRIFPDDRERALALYQAAITEGNDHEFEYRAVAADGRVVWLRDIVHVVRGVEARAEQLRGVMVDITQWKRAGGTPRESEERLRAIFENSAIGIALADLKGRFVLANRAFQMMVGYEAEELREMSLTDFTHEEDLEANWTQFAQLSEGKRERFLIEKRYRRKDGDLIWVRNAVSLVPGTEGHPGFVVAVVEDITERKELEEQLRQSHKMEAVGQLAGGVAHDFNNLLTAINGYSELLLERLGRRDPLRKLVSGIRKAGEQATAMTSQLLAFSRQQVLQPKVLDLSAVIADMENMLRRLIGEDIELITVLKSPLGRVRADPVQIEEVILNLAVNARDAMPHGGTLNIEAGNVDLDRTLVHGGIVVPPGVYVMLAVSDTGIGMDAGTQTRIFEPFYTTKDKGTGLGLSTVYGIVKQSGGHISVYSQPGRGTTFKIYLPKVEEPVESAMARSAHARSYRGSETILLVEDELLVREVAVTVLKERGYKVLEASEGDEALSISKRHRGPIHMLLTDVVMPRMSGHALAERLAPLHPRIKVLYISGYSHKGVLPSDALETEVAFLQKPFTPSTLARKVRELLDAEGNVEPK